MHAVHARSTFATSSLLFLLFLLLLFLFHRTMAFLYYQPRLAARGATTKRKRTTNYARTCVSRDYARVQLDRNGTMKIVLFACCLPFSLVCLEQIQYWFLIFFFLNIFFLFLFLFLFLMNYKILVKKLTWSIQEMYKNYIEIYNLEIWFLTMIWWFEIWLND